MASSALVDAHCVELSRSEMVESTGRRDSDRGIHSWVPCRSAKGGKNRRKIGSEPIHGHPRVINMLILYVALKYDYGKPEQSYSFEHYNFYHSLLHMSHDILYFDFATLIEEHGREW